MTNTYAFFAQLSSTLFATLGGVLHWTVDVLAQFGGRLSGLVFACIWCGVAVLRSPGMGTPTQMREKRLTTEDMCPSKRPAGGSIPPLRPNSLAECL